jgi:K+-sensing histidine kinase KdpD
LTNSQRYYSDETIKGFESINNYLRHKAIGNVNIASLALDLYKSDNDKTTIDMIIDSVSNISLMLTRSYEIQSIFEFSGDKSSLKETLELIMPDKHEISKKFQFINDSEILVSDFIRNVFSTYARNTLEYRGANKLEMKADLSNQLKITIIDNGENFSESLKQSIKNNSIFSPEEHNDLNIDLFIMKEILNAHMIEFNLKDNNPKGGIFSLNLNQQDFEIQKMIE